jgi:hypothetical protein
VIEIKPIHIDIILPKPSQDNRKATICPTYTQEKDDLNLRKGKKSLPLLWKHFFDKINRASPVGLQCVALDTARQGKEFESGSMD